MIEEQPIRITWTFEETADRLQVTSRHLRNLMTRGEGPKSVRLGRRILFRPEAVEEWLREKEAA